MRILLDVDGVLGHFTAGACAWLKGHHLRHATDEDITDYNVMTSFGLPDGWPSFITWLSESRFCREMPVYDGAVAFVDGLRKLGEVIAVTSPFVGVDHWEADRRRWLEEHFGIADKDLVFCKRKHLVRGDILIDDKPANVEELAVGQTGVLFSRPWNASHRSVTSMRVGSYRGAVRVVRDWREAAGL